jgi:hypothetical protein
MSDYLLQAGIETSVVPFLSELLLRGEHDKNVFIEELPHSIILD